MAQMNQHVAGAEASSSRPPRGFIRVVVADKEVAISGGRGAAEAGR
jgi:hypothetical protein